MSSVVLVIFVKNISKMQKSPEFKSTWYIFYHILQLLMVYEVSAV